MRAQQRPSLRRCVSVAGYVAFIGQCLHEIRKGALYVRESWSTDDPILALVTFRLRYS